MHNRLYIIGAGGHGKVVADIAFRNGYKEVAFLDDNLVGTCMGIPIIGKTCDIWQLNDGQTDFVIGIGNNKIRKQIAESYHLHWTTLVHPSAQIGMHVGIGAGTVVMAGVVINPCAVIGEHCIINSGAIIEHDNVLEDYVHVSPNVSLGGTVRVGAGSHVGIGATVKNNVDICENCVIGAGAVVITQICQEGIYIGIPAKRINKKE